MADFQLKVTAETQDAERKLGGVQRLADEAAKARQIKLEIPNYSDVSKNFSDLKKDIESATNSIKQFYRVASQLPVGPISNINEVAGQMRAVGTAASESSKSVGDAGAVIKGTLEVAGKAAETLVGKLTRIAFSLYAINEAVKITQAAFGGMFKETIGREIQLRETILKTQTTLASTNKVFKGGKEITDPYEKIVSLTGEVGKRIDSIRERSIALAGVTSNDVIEVFGIVASQVGQIGGGLKEAEDLAINFAAALGTFGIPLYQARQEVGSILRGDITMDSYLAKALGITNEDIAKAKTEAGGVVKFLEDRLAAAVAGQRIAAEGFAGVVSNIKDLSELINQNFGRGLLDPLIDGLSKVFGFLFGIRKELFGIASQAGSSLGNLLSIGFGRTLGASGGSRRSGGGGGGRISRDQTRRPVQQESGFGADDVLKGIESAIKQVTLELNKALSTVYLQLATLTERAANAFGAITKGLAALAMGLLSLKLEQLKALIGAFEAVSPALLAATKGLSGFLALWGEFLKLPLVQEISQISANMRLLEMVGVIPLIKSAFILKGIIENWGKVVDFVVNQFNKLRAILGGLIAYIGTVAVAASEAGRRLLTAWQPSGIALKALKAELEQVVVQLNQVGAAAQQAGTKLGSLNAQGKAAGGGILGLVGNFIKFNLMMFVISATLGLVLERFSAWKEAQDKLASDKRAEEALRRLNTTYKDIGDSADEATKRAKSFEESLVNAKYDEAVQNLEKVRKKLAELRDLSNERLGNVIPRVLQQLNLANSDVRPQQGESFADAVYRTRLEDSKRAEQEVQKYSIEINKLAAKEKITLEARNRVNLEKEIKDIRIAQENDLFRQRQTLAQKEVEIFRAAGELRIFQMEQANAKLIEGEEGASAAALEALNNYISTRERGELDIESAKKSLVIEVANLEKEISNYRLENEKKIAEIRKRAGDYDKKIADYQRQAAGATGPAITDGFRVGNTGRSTGPHLDIRSPVGDSQKVIDEAVQIIKAWQAMGVAYIQLSNTGRDVKGLTLEGDLRAALAEEQRVHARRSGGGAIDIAVPEGTVVPRRTGTPSWDSGGGGWMATSLDSGNIFLHGQQASKASITASQAPITEPTFQGYDDIGAPAVQRYAEAVRGAASALEVVRARQEALTNAKTAAAFDAIAKAAFQPVALEQYRDQIIQAEAALEALARTSGEAYSPEHLQIQVDMVSKIRTATAELQQLIKGFDVRTDLSDKEKKAAIEAQIDAHNKKVQSIRKEAVLREQVLDITRKQTAIERLRAATNAIRFDVARAGVQAQATMAQAFAGDDSAALRRIEAEQKIAEKRIELEEQFGKGSEEVTRELTAFADRTRSAATELGALDNQVKAFTEQMATIRDVSKTLVDSYKGVAKSFLSGGDLKDAVNQMSQAITDKIVGIALDSAFKPMEDMFVKTLKDVFGMQDPTIALQEQNNQALVSNTIALEKATAAIASSAGTGLSQALPGTESEYELMSRLSTRGPAYVQEIEGMLEQEFKGIGESLTQLGTVAETTSKQTGNAAITGEKGFGKFLGAMTGVATGALAITGAIQAMQDSNGGTYGTLMGIAGVLGGLGSVFGGFASLGKRAAGGPVSANRPYVVGEVGPELFVPGASGTVIPNNKLASNPYAASSEYLGQMGASPRAMRSEPIRVDTRVINGVEYVTADQLREATRQAEIRGAERGRSLALGSLQNSVRTRKKVGLA